jgi:hypothetical protein
VKTNGTNSWPSCPWSSRLTNSNPSDLARAPSLSTPSGVFHTIAGIFPLLATFVASSILQRRRSARSIARHSSTFGVAYLQGRAIAGIIEILWVLRSACEPGRDAERLLVHVVVATSHSAATFLASRLARASSCRAHSPRDHAYVAAILSIRYARSRLFTGPPWASYSGPWSATGDRLPTASESRRVARDAGRSRLAGTWGAPKSDGRLWPAMRLSCEDQWLYPSAASSLTAPRQDSPRECAPPSHHRLRPERTHWPAWRASPDRSS